MSKATRVAYLLAAIFLITAFAFAQTNWTQFRGPGARGVADGERLPSTWSTTENIAWKTDIPGRGWSSPVVWGDNVFITTVVNTGESEDPKKGLYFGGERPKPQDTVHRWVVMCLSLDTGKVKWERQVHEGKPATPIHIKNSYASETAVTDGDRVYCYFGNQGLYCFDFEGTSVWSKPFEPERIRFGWGTAASPVLYEGRLYIVNDNLEGSYLLALDSKTGEEVWRVEREEESNWSTPYVWVNDKRTEIITPGSDKTRSYDLEGNLLWSYAGMSSITIATPYAYDGLLYLSSGYVGDKYRPLYAIKPGATGDISITPEDTSSEWIAWHQPKGAPYNPSTLGYNGRTYVLYDRGRVSCFNAKDGSVVYEEQRLPKGAGYTVSPWAYDDKIFCLNEDGVTHVLKAGDTFEVMHTNTLAEDDMGMASPAIVGNRLLLRTAARIYCVQDGEGS